MKKKIIITIVIFIALFLAFKGIKKIDLNPNYTVGQPIDTLNNVVVYYNGWTSNVSGRNTKDGYNLGLKYQCVEFVKRYYYEYYDHKMPDSYGHAVSFFDPSITDGKINPRRGLTQYKNRSYSQPKEGDLLVMKGTAFNKYGHVAIVSKVLYGEIEIIQQNPGMFAKSRVYYKTYSDPKKRWIIDNSRILGWLRKE